MVACLPRLGCSVAMQKNFCFTCVNSRHSMPLPDMTVPDQSFRLARNKEFEAVRHRVAAWSKGPDELARVVRRQKEESRRALIRSAELQRSAPKKISRAVFNRAELNAQRRERYQADKTRRREIEANVSPAQRAAQNWLKWRERHAAREKTPEQAARDWLAYREAQKLGVPSRVATRDVSRDEGCGRGKARERARDYGLEL